MLRRSCALRNIQLRKSLNAAIGNGNSQAFKLSMSHAFGVSQDKVREYEDMQVGMFKNKIEADRKEAAAFLELPREEQIRRYMLKMGKFDVDLVRKNNMDVKLEFERFKVAHRRQQKKGSRSFWIPMVMATIGTLCGPIYLVTNWY
jgi:hypothetical protein